MQYNNLEKNSIGIVLAVLGQVVEAEFPLNPPVLHEQLALEKDPSVIMEVVSVAQERIVRCVLFSPPEKIRRGDTLIRLHKPLSFPASSNLLGTVVDMFGGGVGVHTSKAKDKEDMPLRSLPDKFSLESHKKKELLPTGIKAVDFFTPLLKGGRIGLFGGAGVGKTVILTELINNLVITKSSLKDAVCVYCAVGERIREAHELCENLKKAKVFNKVSVVLGQMGENPAVRSRTPLAAVALTEYHKNYLGHDVVFFMDNAYRFAQAGQEISGISQNFPSEDGYQPTLTSEMANLHERLSSGERGTVTSVEAVFVPSDDVSDSGVRELLPYMDSFIMLSRDEYQKGRMPAIEILKSSSSALREDIVGRHHINAVNEAKRVLEKAENLERVVSLIGPSELSVEDQKIFKRAQIIKNYMTQPFFIVENQTGRKGEYVTIPDTVEDVMGIVEGKWDAKDPEEFLYIGKIPFKL